MPEVEHRGQRLHYTDTGSGPALLLGHSFLCDGEMWGPQLTALQDEFRVLNADLRGHGRSGPSTAPFDLADLIEDALAVLDHAGVSQAIWCGLSIGGMVAMRAALTYPERVAGLVLINTTAGVDPADKQLRYRALALLARTVSIKPAVPAVMGLMFGATTRRTQPALCAAWQRKFAALHVPSIQQGLGCLLRRRDVHDRLVQIDAPTLVIAGEEDRAIPPRLAISLAARIRGAELQGIAEAGHLATLERPAAVTEVLLDFLRRQAS